MSNRPALTLQSSASKAGQQNTAEKTSAEQSLSDVEARRLQALLERFGSLPLPIAVAMVKRASDGPVGIVLNQLEAALDQLNGLPELQGLTGSEVRVLHVTLHLISTRITELQNSLNQVSGAGS